MIAYLKSMIGTYFRSKVEFYVWLILACSLLPLAMWGRFFGLSNVLVEPHPWRQAQTALPIYYFEKQGIDLLDYRSPKEGQLWSFVYEFPLYQASVALLMRVSGLSLEVASRAICLAAFFLGWLFLVGIIRSVIGTYAVAWVGLLYLVTPFSVVFSRVCLVETTALCFLLGFLWMYIKAFSQSVRTPYRFLLLGAVLGSVASVVKVQLWYIPVSFCFVTLTHYFFRGKYPKRRLVVAMALLLVQLACSLAWIKWSSHIRGDAGKVFVQVGWFFGNLHSRLYWDSWAPIVDYWARRVLHDWLVLPFLVGLFFAKGYRRLSWILFASVLLPILVMFNVHQKHDYYLVGQMPAILTIATMGLLYLFHRRTPVAYAGLAVVATVLVFRVSKIAYFYTPILHDYRTELLEAYTLKSVTVPEDVVYAHRKEGSLELPLYSERLVATWSFTNLDRLKPSVLYFPDRVIETKKFDSFSTVWMDSQLAGATFYRVKEVGHKSFDASRHFGVSSEWDTLNSVGVSSTVFQLDHCHRQAPFRLRLRSPWGSGRVKIVGRFSGKELILPARRVINIPHRSHFDCQMIVHFEGEPQTRVN